MTQQFHSKYTKIYAHVCMYAQKDWRDDVHNL
jgi:hypothetical protein